MSNPTGKHNQTSQDHPLRKFISSIVSIHYSLFQRRCLLAEDNRKALHGQVTGPKIAAQTVSVPVGSCCMPFHLTGNAIVTYIPRCRNSSTTSNTSPPINRTSVLTPPGLSLSLFIIMYSV